MTFSVINVIPNTIHSHSQSHWPDLFSIFHLIPVTIAHSNWTYSQWGVLECFKSLNMADQHRSIKTGTLLMRIHTIAPHTIPQTVGSSA